MDDNCVQPQKKTSHLERRVAELRNELEAMKKQLKDAVDTQDEVIQENMELKEERTKLERYCAELRVKLKASEGKLNQFPEAPDSLIDEKREPAEESAQLIRDGRQLNPPIPHPGREPHEQSWWLKSPFKCSRCDQLTKQLQDLYTELNVATRKHQGDFRDSKSADELHREYESFFTNVVDDVLQNVPEKDKNEAREQLCSIFQDVYSCVTSRITGELTSKLKDMLQWTKLEQHTSKDLVAAYGRLLSATDIIGSQCPLPLDVELMKKCFPSSVLQRIDLHQYVSRALQLTWNLATAVPPLIASCGPKTFSEEHHERASTAWDDKYDSNNTIRYFRPVLFNFSSGVQKRGCVSNAKLDAARALPNVHNVMSELVNVKQWNTLAHNLCLPPQEIVTINYQAHVAIVNLWFQMFGPTWNTLANALDNSGEHETAANIRSKYM